MMGKRQLIDRLQKMGFPKKVIDAFSSVEREDFVSHEFEDKAYDDEALPIGGGQTISQPYTIAVMLAELSPKKGQKILEVGSGSGYVLALLSEIVEDKGRVYGIEIIKELAEKSKKILSSYKNVEVYNKTGVKGLPKKAPFDRILMSAACREVPEELLNQLKDNGILVAPKGPRFGQSIVVIQRQKDKFITKSEIPGFIFVPFIE